jgi:hypothetical protein
MLNREKPSMKKTKLGTTRNLELDSDREAVLGERETLQRMFPLRYSAEIGVWNGNNVEVMLRLTCSQAANLARLLKENSL